MNRYTSKNLLELIREKIEGRLSDGGVSLTRVLWWDDGGYLKPLIQEVCRDLNIGFTASDNNPLSLRLMALEEGEEKRVWYVPEKKKDRDWFRDIKEVGGEIEGNIEELSAELYGTTLWEILDYDSIEKNRQSRASILCNELNRTTGRPSLSQLKKELITKGHGSPVDFILMKGWELDRDEKTVKRVKEILIEDGIQIFTPADGPEEIEEKLKLFATSQWLIKEGLPLEVFSEEYRKKPELHGIQFSLKRLLEQQGHNHLHLIREYLRPRFRVELEKIDPWELVECPVEGYLDYRLWEDWLNLYQDKDYNKCQEKALKRLRILCNAYGHKIEKLNQKSSPFLLIWYQGYLLALLSLNLTTWEQRIGQVNLLELYGARSNGTWHIDSLIRKILLTGSPEREITGDHPAHSRLPTIRSQLVNREYFKYLETLSDVTEDILKNKGIFNKSLSVHQFWDKYREELAAGESVVLFFIDALRLDLARELTELLENNQDQTSIYEVKEDLWLGVLPSETEYGMGALTPGRSATFRIELDGNKLKAKRNADRLSTKKREKLLEFEGFSVTRDHKTGWEGQRVAYFDEEIDLIGENELSNLEEKLITRVSQLAALIKKAMEKGDWTKAFVVTDHGFVLLPENTNLETINLPREALDVKRRSYTAERIEDDSPGLVIDKNMIPYVETPIKILVNPLQRYQKKGIGDTRYFHGGALPQEFILIFLKVERTSEEFKPSLF